MEHCGPPPELEAGLQAALAQQTIAENNMELAKDKLKIATLLQESRQHVAQLEHECKVFASGVARAHRDRIDGNRKIALEKRAARMGSEAFNNPSQTTSVSVKRTADAMTEGVLVDADPVDRIETNRQVALAKRAAKVAAEAATSPPETIVEIVPDASDAASQSVEIMTAASSCDAELQS